MVDQDQLITIILESCRFLNQNDLISLALVSRRLYENVAIERLYYDISITKDPVLRNEKCYFDSGKTYISGYRALKRTEDQNDLFLYDRIERLLESNNLRLIKHLQIQANLFSDKKSGKVLLRRLLDKILELDEIQLLDIRNDHLFLEYYPKILKLTKLKKIKIIDTEWLREVKSFSTLKSLEWIIEQPKLTKDYINAEALEFFTERLEKCEFIVDNMESSSFKVIKFLSENGIKCNKLKSLKFNHLYGTNAHNENHKGTSLKWLSDVMNLGKLKTLELGISNENIDHEFVDEFLKDLAPKLNSLRHLALTETTPVELCDCVLKEEWDLVVSRFILDIPNVEQKLHTLNITHRTPLNGLCDNSVQGNYTRRRVLYETVLPQLSALQKLIAPNLLQTLAVYEILACDILWNGCECDYCKKILPLFDEYVMNHQYYSRIDGRYLDIIPTVFFSYAGNYLSSRFNDRVEWETEVFKLAPLYRNWDFRGYEQIHHFENYEDLFDESAFGPLCKVISHFFNGYMDNLVCLLPNLKMAMFSGIYYSIDDETRSYECIYD